jgi:hypothetical protein
MKNWLYLAMLAGGAYVLYEYIKSREAAAVPAPVSVKPLLPLTPGAVFTGRIQSTNTGRPPNYVDDVVGYAPGDWAETVAPNGRTDWVPISTNGANASTQIPADQPSH